jgi:hypothetical protein
MAVVKRCARVVRRQVLQQNLAGLPLSDRCDNDVAATVRSSSTSRVAGPQQTPAVERWIARWAHQLPAENSTGANDEQN